MGSNQSQLRRLDPADRPAAGVRYRPSAAASSPLRQPGCGAVLLLAVDRRCTVFLADCPDAYHLDRSPLVGGERRVYPHAAGRLDRLSGEFATRRAVLSQTLSEPLRLDGEVAAERHRHAGQLADQYADGLWPRIFLRQRAAVPQPADGRAAGPVPAGA